MPKNPKCKSIRTIGTKRKIDWELKYEREGEIERVSLHCSQTVCGTVVVATVPFLQQQ
jgi:hypothetical protein